MGARSWSEYGKAKIILVHACDLLELTFKDNLALKKEFNRAVIKEATEKLSLCKKSIAATEGILVQTKLYEGLVTETILHAAKIHKASLIVMGTLGSAAAKEKILGSKTAAVIGKTVIPVLVIPLLSEWKTPKNILLAIHNFKEAGKDMVSPVFDLTSLFNATLHLAKFTDMDTASSADYLADKKGLAASAGKLGEKYQTAIKTVHLDGHRFEKTIEKYIRDKGIDITAMITHRRAFLKSIFKRSMTKKMSYHTAIPLLAIPASG